ncbi:ABC-F family ATP-binding cassette domain-containing protein [Marinicrinis lubricantis]|uniref:ABC-F family ATP-binding cassette domain-containing protein n=1 Tax=Marinicrinis lubricantis TaxID=2086470 RepID=A0ABW1IRD3_9BACL
MLLQATGIHKSYGTEPILTNIYFQIQEKERIGLVGVNGAGKSTLMKILAGVLTPDSGEIHKPKDMVLGYLAQNSGLETQRSIWDEMMEVFRRLLDVEQSMRALEQKISEKAAAGEQDQYEALLQKYDEKAEYFRLHHGYEIEAKVRGLLHGMGFGDIPFDTPIHYLSGGQKTRLALCKLLLQEPDLLMLDEPTNYLDIDTLTWLEDYLRHYSGAILVVSHDRYFLDALVDTIYEIERHQAKRYTGNYSKYLELKQADYETALKQYEQQQGEIAKLEDFVRKNLARASTTKRAQSRRKALERMERLDRPGGELKKAHFTFEIEKMTGQEVLKVDQLGFGYTEGTLLFDNVTFALNRGEMVALVGPNGTGKSTLLHILTGQYVPTHGNVHWGSNVKLGYYDQEQEDLNLQNTILEELWSTYPHLDELTIRTVLGNFLFSGDDVLKRIKDLSGGEKARVCLAKLMLLRANVLILDEPTNHLDLFSKEILESALMDYEGTVLFISHDRYFLNKMAERVVELSSDGIQHFLGNYDDYMEKKRELSELEQPATDNPPHSADRTQETTNYEQSKQQKKEERIRQRKIEKLEEDISELEGIIANIENTLSDPDLAADYIKLQETNDQLETHKKQLEKLYEQWEALSS